MKRRTNPSLWTVRQVSELYCNIRTASSPDWFFGIGKYGPFRNTYLQFGQNSLPRYISCLA